MVRFLLATLPFLSLAPISAQPLPHPPTQEERFAIGIGDRVLYDSSDLDGHATPYVASPEGAATLHLHVDPGEPSLWWSCAVVSGTTTHYSSGLLVGPQTLTIPLDPGTYDVTSFISGPTLVYRSVPVQGETRDTLRASDANLTYTVEARDEAGGPAFGSYARGMTYYHEPSGYWYWSDTTGGQPYAQILHHTDAPAGYGFDIELLTRPNLPTRYRVGFRTRDFSESRTETNDPADYRRYVYTVPVADPEAPPLVMWLDHGIHATVYTLPSWLNAPYEVETYVQRQPAFPFPFAHMYSDGGPPHRFAAFEVPFEILGGNPPEIGRAYPALPSVEHRSDGTLHLGYPSSYRSPTVELTEERLPVHLAPVHYFGRIHRIDGTEFLAAATPGFSYLPAHGGGPFTVQPFPAQANTADLDPVPYTLYDGSGNVIASGPDASVLFAPGFPQTGPEPRALALTHDRTRVGGETPSVATARLDFDLDREDPSPPALGDLTHPQDRRRTHTRNSPTDAALAFSVLDESAVPTVTSDYRAHGAADWVPLPFSPDGDGFRAPLPPDLPLDALYDLRFTLKDEPGNEVLFTVEPAFATATSTANEPDMLAQGLALALPYPNPARTAATVTFSLAEPGRARLAAYDLLGREVAVLVDGERPSGKSEAALDVSGWPSGTYVLRLTAAGGKAQRRFTVVR